MLSLPFFYDTFFQSCFRITKTNSSIMHGLNAHSSQLSKLNFPQTRSLSLRVLSLACLILGSGTVAPGQIAKSGAATDQSTAAIDQKVEVWAAPAEQKVRPDDRVEAANLVWSKDNKTIRLAGAGNEHVPFQVIVTTPIPPGRRP